MAEFLAENNICGQTILQLVSRGNAIIAEILRLKDFIPNVYRLETKQDVQKYGDIIMDFSYFKIAEVQENKIEQNEALHELDKEFRDNNINIITRFYSVFECILIYITDLNHYIDDLVEGVFIHQSMESVLADMEGKQLLCEALFLYGTMLLILDAHIDGIIRERLVVSYYRYTPQKRDSQSCIDEVCKLLRDTGYTATKKPNNYPEDYFRRVPIASLYIDVVLSVLRSDDLYTQLAVYPLPAHRSVALAPQAAMLYVILFFSPSLLHSQTAVMREVVDKYFPDNWVLSVYMGFTVNLIGEWDSFKAARAALSNTLEVGNVRAVAGRCWTALEEQLAVSGRLLNVLRGQVGDLGTVDEDEVLLGKIQEVMGSLRESNVVIRWLMLHTIPPANSNLSLTPRRIRQLRELVLSSYTPPVTPPSSSSSSTTSLSSSTPSSLTHHQQLFRLLLTTGQIELITRDRYRTVLDERVARWRAAQAEAVSSLAELATVFSGTTAAGGGLLLRGVVGKNENLVRWFGEIGGQVAGLEVEEGRDGVRVARRLVQLVQALEEVEEFHQLKSSMQVIQYLTETRGFLHKMIRLMKIKEDILINMQIIGDLSYAWELIDVFTPLMQRHIKTEPKLVRRLRSVFLKLATALEAPLVRINQAHSGDLVSVANYYSGALENYIRRVLQVIPVTMFSLLERVIEIQTHDLIPLPARLEKEKLREFAQLEVRYEFAELTHGISLFSEGMCMMQTTLVGIVCLDPKKLLEDGIRKELVQHISKALHIELRFVPKSKQEDFKKTLNSVVKIMDGYKKSFEYIEDYININGLKIWQEEVTRIINYNVEQECNGFLKTKINEWESLYQSRHVPIPNYPQLDGSLNFIGRLAREIIRITDPKNNMFVEHMTTWHDCKTKKIILDKSDISLIAQAIDITGLVGLDRLFSNMIVIYLKKIKDILINKDIKNTVWTNTLQTICKDLENLEQVTDYSKFYQNCINRSSKLFATIFEYTCIVGQLQILRKMLMFHLNLTCRFNVKSLESSLNSLNQSLLNDLKKPEDSTPQPSEDFLLELTKYFDYAGISNPVNNIYISVKSERIFATHLFIFTISSLGKLGFLSNGTDNRKSLGTTDSISYIIGMHTILRQFHNELNSDYIEHISKYILNITKQSIKLKNNDIPLEAVLMIQLMKQYTKYSHDSQDCFIKYFPEEIMHLLTTPS